MADSLQPQGLYPARLFCPWDFPGKNTAVGCHFLLQGILLTQGLNTGLLHCRQILYRLSYKGSDYTVVVTNRFKELDLRVTVPEELWMEVCDIGQEVVIKTIPRKRNAKRQNDSLRKPSK